MIHHDLDVFSFRVFLFPVRRLAESARLARLALDAFGPETERRAAAVHRGVADADDQHPLPDRADMAKGYGLEPGYADVDPVGIVPARQHQLLALRGARADKDC